MRQLFIIILFISSTLTSLAQGEDSRALGNFNKISVGEAIHLILVPGNNNKADISTSNIDVEDVLTSIVGNNLKLELKGNRHSNVKVSITLTYKSINSVTASSASSVKTNGPIKADVLDVSVSSAGNANLDIVVDEVAIEVSSSGELSLSGIDKKQHVEVSSAGVYNGYDLNCEDSYARVSSAGSAKIVATKNIDAKASSAGSVKYKGNPDKVYVNSNSGGHVGKTN